ncbi:hypothetical protein BDV27DRAFT_160457 [Aspergillus caelatus]|uniref:F-box domain-containing protein n=1 Tax=Aspergillus caelatus TaxID=61420 RepID=A0A5N6ZVS8_9EURO|nr:uncharacterized protein BDV27DRAFT_160457 [Aspergillus caelatus]KAE8361711.1 hypothetical protein BDV27DRAFT_160457 [Aspergillus caelatus]
MLLGLPPELLPMIFQNLGNRDLWALFNTSKGVRHNAARTLFRRIKIDHAPCNFPEALNERPLPATRIFQLLGEWLPLVREICIFSYRAVEPCMLNLLGRFPNVERCRLDAERSDESSDSLKQQLIEQPSLRKWYLFNTIPGSWPLLPSFQSLQTLEIRSLSSGTLVVPAMPALLNLRIGFDCSFYNDEKEAGVWDCAVLVDFSTLPRLSRLAISNLDLGDLVFQGKAESLKTLEIFLGQGELSDQLSDILREIGGGLEKIILNDVLGTCSELDVELISIKKIHLIESTGFLPFLIFNKLPALEEITWEQPFRKERRLFQELEAIRSNFPNDKSDWASIMQLTNSNGYLTPFLDLARRRLVDCFEREYEWYYL